MDIRILLLLDLSIKFWKVWMILILDSFTQRHWGFSYKIYFWHVPLHIAGTVKVPAGLPAGLLFIRFWVLNIRCSVLTICVIYKMSESLNIILFPWCAAYIIILHARLKWRCGQNPPGLSLEEYRILKTSLYQMWSFDLKFHNFLLNSVKNIGRGDLGPPILHRWVVSPTLVSLPLLVISVVLARV